MAQVDEVSLMAQVDEVSLLAQKDGTRCSLKMKLLKSVGINLFKKTNKTKKTSGSMSGKKTSKKGPFPKGSGKKKSSHEFKRPFENKFKKQRKFDDFDGQAELISDERSIKNIETYEGLTNDRLKAYHKEAEILRSKPRPTTFTLDPWQQDAVDALNGGANVIVDAPTTAGKTKVVESFFEQHISDGNFRACYTCPVKSLSNDKLREFREEFGRENVGIATGDVKENLDAPIVVATLESYRNSLLGIEPDLGRRLVVFDEYHFLQDDSRGSAWEEAIILTPPSCQMLLLSASLDNGGEFSDWIESITGRPSIFIEVSQRPVPLVNMVYTNDKWVIGDLLPEKYLPKKSNPYILPLHNNEIARRLYDLDNLGLTPTIVYSGKRQSCELLAQAIAKTVPPLTREKAENLKEIVLKLDKEIDGFRFLKPSLKSMIFHSGVAYHHSGLTPQARYLIESLIKEGHLRFCVATMGLSLGINFSVKSTVVADAIRPGQNGFVPYSASEILQMTGRAGRRGKDTVGFSLWLNDKFYSKFAYVVRSSCSSKLKIEPTTFLGLMSRGYSLGKIEQFYQKSLLKHQRSKFDLNIIRKKRLIQNLQVDDLPCHAPSHEFAMFHSERNAICYDCNLQKACHRFIKKRFQNDLSLLQLHLHKIGAIQGDLTLSPYGNLCRYFPQNGGLLIASMLEHNEINEENLHQVIQLLAGFSLACFKSPLVDYGYRFPYNLKRITEEYSELYPIELFPELYDQKFSVKIKEFNESAGFIIHQWAQGCTWEHLVKSVINEKFSQGDITALIYRSAAYLQSIIQATEGPLYQEAKKFRDFLLRDPLQVDL